MPFSEETICAFFSRWDNYVELSLEDIIERIGPFTQYDDWDWGREVYDWKRPNLRIRVVMRGGYVKAVEELDPQDNSRYGTTLRVLWGDVSP
jgi:predicted SpoU family rRNA methylase|uniref:Uncharacterized protein n=1 Tax=Meiothermus ruber TaxID=277 RepID=A0A7C3DPG2_MEIRU